MNVEQLKVLLHERGMHKDAVSFHHGFLTSSEQYCISNEDGVWEVYYFERGNKNDLRRFVDEGCACAYLLAILEKDSTVWQGSRSM
jgi:hypothetical protein